MCDREKCLINAHSRYIDMLCDVSTVCVTSLDHGYSALVQSEQIGLLLLIMLGWEEGGGWGWEGI